MTPALISDPAQMDRRASVAARYVSALARIGVDRLIPNVGSTPLLVSIGDLDLPVMVDDGGYGRSYVASPHSAYVLYARQELDLVGMKRGRTAALAALAVVDRVLRAARVNRVVHLDNWLLSTNLHGDWDGQGLADMRRLLVERYPDHFLAIRTLDDWSSPKLLSAARDDGWILVPARQVWITDNLQRELRERRDYGNDRRALAKSGLVVEDVDRLSPEDFDRVADLYAMLYRKKYSSLNPEFTRDFVALTQTCGLMHYRVARDGDGRILSVAGMLARRGIGTSSVVGYDDTRPRSQALYRIAALMASDWAVQNGLALHGSAGAGHFKRLRGARGMIEYMAIYAGHLPRTRRQAVRSFAATLERFIVPMMKREGW